MSLVPRALFAALLLLLAAVLPSTAVAGTATVEFPPSTASTAVNCPFGYNGLPTTGQVIVAPATAQTLDSMTLWVSHFTPIIGEASGPVTYRAYVYEWDGTKAVGNALFRGPEQTATTSAPVSSPDALTTQLGGIPVVPGKRYVFFLSTSEIAPGTNGPGGAFCTNIAAGVQSFGWVALLNGTDTDAWTRDAWSYGYDNGYRAVYTTPTRYEFDGFYAPINNGALNQVRAGLAIPVRFSLGGDRGLNVFEAGYPKSEATNCGVQDVDGVEQTLEAGASSLSYASGSDTYTYVWKTDKAWADSCRQLVLRFDDGTVARANFSFTK